MSAQQTAPAIPAAIVSGHFALDNERWDAVDAIAFPLEGTDQTLLAFSNIVFNRSVLATEPVLDRSALKIHQLSREAVTLSLLLDAHGTLLATDYGRGGAELDSPLDFAAGLKLTRFDATGIAGTLQHDWIALRFEVPVATRIVVATTAAALDHPAATTLRQLLTALHGGDDATWLKLSQPDGHEPNERDRADMQMARKAMPSLQKIEAVRLEGDQALVDFVGSQGAATAVMALEDGRWMLLQISPR